MNLKNIPSSPSVRVIGVSTADEIQVKADEQLQLKKAVENSKRNMATDAHF